MNNQIYLSLAEIRHLSAYAEKQAKEDKGDKRFLLCGEDFAIWTKITVGEQTTNRRGLLNVTDISDSDD